MSNLTPAEYNGQRILTTKQLAQVYETDEVRIQQNFARNKDHFEEGKHYYMLKGETLREFKANYPEDSNLKFASELTLWTERGANRHCKILDTDKAWEQFDHLEETYFKVKPNLLPQSFPEALRALADAEEQKLLMLPKAAAFDQFLDGGNNQKMNVVAKTLGLGRNKLFSRLRELRILMSDNTPYQGYVDRGYFVVKQKPITMGEETINKPQTFVTPKGVEYIRRTLNEKKVG